MGNGEGGNECECCGCTIVADKLTGSSVPGFLTIASGSWSINSSGLKTISSNAKIMCVAPATGSSYKGVVASVDVTNANAGDVFVFYFNAGWQARIVIDDGTGTSGYFGIYDAGGNLINRAPSFGAITAFSTVFLCLTEDASAGSSFSGGAVTFGPIGAALTVSTLAVGFGTGSQNTGGMKFENFSLQNANWTGEGSDPLSCPVCTCNSVPPWRGTWAQMEALTFTLGVSGLSAGSNGDSGECGDCEAQNGSYVLTYVPGPDPNSGFTGAYHVDVDDGPSCLNPDDELTGQFDIAIGGGGCAHSTITLSGLIPYGTIGGGPIGVGFLNLASLSAVNTALTAAIGSGAIAGAIGVPGYCAQSTLGAGNLTLVAA